MKSFKANFETVSWQETTDHEQDQKKLTTTRMVRSSTGEVEGRSEVSYLMAYQDSSRATFVGLERFEGRIGDHTGSMVIKLSGVFINGILEEDGVIVAGSGTGQLKDIAGATRCSTPLASRYSVQYVVRLPDLERTEVPASSVRL